MRRSSHKNKERHHNKSKSIDINIKQNNMSNNSGHGVVKTTFNNPL